MFLHLIDKMIVIFLIRDNYNTVLSDDVGLDEVSSPCGLPTKAYRISYFTTWDNDSKLDLNGRLMLLSC